MTSGVLQNPFGWWQNHLMHNTARLLLRLRERWQLRWVVRGKAPSQVMRNH